MIPQAYITAWQSEAPWQSDIQIEQDLIISRIVAEIYSDDFLRDSLLFRGGTALHKLIFEKPFRFSEDIDLVQRKAGPIKPIVEAIQRRMDPWLDRGGTETRRDGFRIYYRFTAEGDPLHSRRIKIEINTREHFTVFGAEQIDYLIDNPWYAVQVEVSSYSAHELAGTKLRALYQRKKGRDLFDLHRLLMDKSVDPTKVAEAFSQYVASQELVISQSDFLVNLEEKMNDGTFLSDTEALLIPTVEYNPLEAAENVKKLIRLL